MNALRRPNASRVRRDVIEVGVVIERFAAADLPRRTSSRVARRRNSPTFPLRNRGSPPRRGCGTRTNRGVVG